MTIAKKMLLLLAASMLGMLILTGTGYYQMNRFTKSLN